MRISDWSSDVCSSDLQHPDGYGHCRCVADRRVVGMGCLDVGFRSGPGLLGEGSGQYDCYSLFRPAQFQLPGHWRHGWVRRIVAGFSTADHRSEEHTSELQSLMRISYAVFCLKKKNK